MAILKPKNIEEFEKPPKPRFVVKCEHWLAWEKDDQDEHFGWGLKIVFKKGTAVVVAILKFCEDCAQKELVKRRKRTGGTIVAQMPWGMLTTEGLRKRMLNNPELRFEDLTPRGKRQTEAAVAGMRPTTETIQ